MTILIGQVTKAEGASGLIQKLDITPKELFSVLSDEDKQRIIDSYNQEREDSWDDCDEPVKSIENLPDWVYEDWREWITFHNPEDLAMMVLRNRDAEYIHLAESAMGTTFHTVVKVNR